MKYVYEVIYTNIHTGSRDGDYFSSMKAAEKWKRIKEEGGIYSVEVAQWKVYGLQDI